MVARKPQPQNLRENFTQKLRHQSTFVAQTLDAQDKRQIPAGPSLVTGGNSFSSQCLTLHPLVQGCWLLLYGLVAKGESATQTSPPSGQLAVSHLLFEPSGYPPQLPGVLWNLPHTTEEGD